MKTNLYKTALLIALVFAATDIQAQSARRPATQDSKQRSTTVRTANRESASQKAKNAQPAKKAQAQPVRTQQARSTQTAKKAPAPAQQARSTQPARKAPAPQVRNQSGRTVQTARNTQTPQVRKPVSLTTTRNPRSDYRESATRITANEHYTAPVRSTKYRNASYYGGIHYHYAYPAGKVNIHYHHDTYFNGYRVLYYPTYHDIFWTRAMYHDYMRWYPEYHWRYNYGYRIQIISIFDAKYNMGEVAMVYGRVYATWYNEETDDYLLFFGGDFPNQQFTVVLPRYVARKYNWRPERFFLGKHITVTGLITTYDGSPEIVVKNNRQLELY